MARQPGASFLTVDFVKEQMDTAVAAAAKDYADLLHGEIWSQLDNSTGEPPTAERWHLWFDSPLEAAYWVWWKSITDADKFARRDIDLLWHVDVDVLGERYVLDAVIGCSSFPVSPEKDYVKARWPLIAIELDGHAFHEKTLEQVTRRNQRDRTLQRAGFKVFHYSFSEFVNDQALCIVEPLDYAREQYSRLLNDYHKSRRAEKATPDGADS